MTDITKYKSIAIPLSTYKQITEVAQTGFDVPMSRSKAVQHIFNIWTGNVATKQKLVEETVYDSDNNLNSYRYYSENPKPIPNYYGIQNDRIKRKLSERQSELVGGKQKEQCK